MSKPVVQLTSDSPISSVALIDNPNTGKSVSKSSTHSEEEIQKINQVTGALQQAAEAIQECGQQMVSSHREQLVRLSIEIAAKVLAKDIHERNYEIEKILTEALEEVPTGQSVTVKLNPEDLKTYQQLLDQKACQPPSHIQLAPDWTVGPGQCIVETTQGVIEWIIEEHLKRISAALLGSSENQ